MLTPLPTPWQAGGRTLGPEQGPRQELHDKLAGMVWPLRTRLGHGLNSCMQISLLIQSHATCVQELSHVPEDILNEAMALKGDVGMDTDAPTFPCEVARLLVSMGIGLVYRYIRVRSLGRPCSLYADNSEMLGSAYDSSGGHVGTGGSLNSHGSTSHEVRPWNEFFPSASLGVTNCSETQVPRFLRRVSGVEDSFCLQLTGFLSIWNSRCQPNRNFSILTRQSRQTH